MAEINSAGTPMSICEERWGESSAEKKKRKQLIEQIRKWKSPFLVGTIERVNERVGNLDRTLQHHTNLACVRKERVAKVSEEFVSQSKEKYDKKEAEKKEERFAESYSIHSKVFYFPNLFDSKLLAGSVYVAKQKVRGVNIRDKTKSKSRSSTKSDSQIQEMKHVRKPKLIEVHQFPGFERTQLTPLPNNVQASSILKIALNAHFVKSSNGISCRPGFEKPFFCPASEAVLQDIFWYLFLKNFQPTQSVQMKLFDRLCHNFVKVCILARNSYYYNQFLAEYPMLMSEATYSTFCHSFPDSIRQFQGETFRETLVDLVVLWMTGTKASPRIWLRWNFNVLEPETIIIQDEKQNKKSLSVDLENLGESSMHFSSSLDTGSNSTFSHTDSSSPRKSVRKQLLQNAKNSDAILKKQKLKTEKVDSNCFENTESSECVTWVDKVKAKTLRNSRESHPAGRGADIKKVCFNINGVCPLVDHFLNSQNVQSAAGMKIKLQRTQLESLPPLDAITYRGIIKESYQKVNEISKSYQRFYENNQKEYAARHQKYLSDMHKQMNKQACLLKNQVEVKKLSDLIILEQKTDKRSKEEDDDASSELQATLDAIFE